MPSRQPTDETHRILLAAHDGRLVRNANFRWVIEGEAPPLRAEREWLQRRGLLAYASSARDRLIVTAPGLALLARDSRSDHRPRH